MSIKSVVIDTTSCSNKRSILFAFKPQFFLVNLCIETIISKMLCSMGHAQLKNNDEVGKSFSFMFRTKKENLKIGCSVYIWLVVLRNYILLYIQNF